MERYSNNSFVHLPAGSDQQDGTCTPASDARRIFSDAVFQKSVAKIPLSMFWSMGWDCLKETSVEFAINLNNR